MNKEILIEALEIAINNFDYDNEWDKADEVRDYLDNIKKEKEGEIHKCAVCDSDKVNEKPKIKDSFHGLQYLCDDDEKGCWDSYEGWYCDTCKLLHDHDTTMESDNSCRKEGE